MKRLGLIGYPLTHSFSKAWFTEKFLKEGITDWGYDLFPIQSIDELPNLVRSTPQLRGLNITIPYKETVLKYLDTLSAEVMEIGAVNTIAIERTENGPVLKGFNTDAPAFEQTFVRQLQPYHANALVLGTGGASKAVQYVLKKLGMEFTVVSRRPGPDYLTYADVNEGVIYAHPVIINTSPVGMYPDVENSPDIPYEAIGSTHLLYDLIYNPAETSFLKKGRERGASTKNGLEMLQLQAEKAWEIWSRSAAPVSKAAQ
jgi:shikimate dehydrogenase